MEKLTRVVFQVEVMLENWVLTNRRRRLAEGEVEGQEVEREEVDDE